MIEKLKLNLSLFARNHRLSLWILLLLLTAIILLFPVHLTLEYHPVQSLHIFDSLPLFGALFYIWLLLLLLLLFSGRSEGKTDWEKLALVCISSLVFLAFWAIILPYGRLDSVNNGAIVRVIQQGGVIPLGRFGYADFPSFFLIIDSLSQITGLGIFEAAQLFLVCNAPIFAALLYLLFTKSFKSTSVAAFAALLVMLGNAFLARSYTFWPGTPSLTILVAFLVVLTRGQHSFLETWQDRMIAIILLVAATTMYFQTSVLFLLIVVGMYLVQRLGKMTPVAISTIWLFAVIPIAWQMYWAIGNFGNITRLLPKIAADIIQGTFLDWAPFLAKGHVGGRLPLWASGINIFWWVVIFGPGTILGLRNLFRVRKLSRVERAETGGLLGVIMLATIATLISPGGERFVHFIHYAAFFTVPIMLRFSLNLGKRIKGNGFTLLVILFFVLSFPTFLAGNGRINLDAYYHYQFASSEFLERSYGSGKELTLRGMIGPEDYYMLENHREPILHGVPLTNEDLLWHRVDRAMAEFQTRPVASGDIEPGTKTITATSPASGLENADYSTSLTLATPADAQGVVTKLVAWIAVNIDSLDRATRLYCRVYFDARDGSHLVFSEEWDVTAKPALNTTRISRPLKDVIFNRLVDGSPHALAVTRISETDEVAVFNRLVDGSPHTFYFFFWVDAGNAVISSVQLGEGMELPVLAIHNGLVEDMMQTVFIMHNRYKVRAEYDLGISPTDPHWRVMEDGLSGADRIYDNGYVQIYK